MKIKHAVSLVNEAVYGKEKVDVFGAIFKGALMSIVRNYENEILPMFTEVDDLGEPNNQRVDEEGKEYEEAKTKAELWRSIAYTLGHTLKKAEHKQERAALIQALTLIEGVADYCEGLE